jgi:hypothetical protein
MAGALEPSCIKSPLVWSVAFNISYSGHSPSLPMRVPDGPSPRTMFFLKKSFFFSFIFFLFSFSFFSRIHDYFYFILLLSYIFISYFLLLISYFFFGRRGQFWNLLFGINELLMNLWIFYRNINIVSKIYDHFFNCKNNS